MVIGSWMRGQRRIPESRGFVLGLGEWIQLFCWGGEDRRSTGAGMDGFGTVTNGLRKGAGVFTKGRSSGGSPGTSAS